jgi:hypothetical protein
MPFKSKRQARKFEALAKEGKISKETLEEWRKATDYSNLPETAEGDDVSNIDGPLAAQEKSEETIEQKSQDPASKYFQHEKDVTRQSMAGASYQFVQHPGDEPVQGVLHAGNDHKEEIDRSTPTHISQEEANYVTWSDKNHCDDCAHFRAANSCTEVRGIIMPMGTCKYFDAALLHAPHVPNSQAAPVEPPATSPVADSKDKSKTVKQPKPKNVATPKEIDKAALNVEPWPTLLEATTGNYKKAIVQFKGLTVTIESVKGSIRSHHDQFGEHWTVILKNHYGSVKGGGVERDGGAVDCFLGESPESDAAFIVDQLDPYTSRFDEHKVILACNNMEDARAIYFANYEIGWKGFGAITQMSLNDFKEWLKNGDHTQPVYRALVGTQPKELEGKQWIGQGSAVDSRNEEDDNEILYSSENEWQLLSDSTSKTLTVRQLMAVADSLNINKRVYPRPVITPALSELGERASQDAVLMELLHPEPVKTESGESQYVDNADRKTARVNSVELPQPDGRVFFTFTTLTTPPGQLVADSYRSGKPYGVSMRFKMKPSSRRQQVNGVDAIVAERMYICSVDHVPNPAIPATKEQYVLLTDSVLQEISQNSAESVDNSRNKEYSVIGAIPKRYAYSSCRFVNAAATDETQTMNDKIKAALNEAHALIHDKASKKKVMAAYDAVNDLLKAARLNGEDIISASKELAALDEVMGVYGYHGDRPGPSAVPGNDVSGKGNTGFGTDTTSGAATAPTNPSAKDFGEAERKESKVQGAGGTAPGMDSVMSSKALATALGVSEGSINALREQMLKAEQQAASDAVQTAIDSAIEENKPQIASFDPVYQDFILNMIKTNAKSPEQVPGLFTDNIKVFSSMAARERLRGGGYDTARSGAGQTTFDPANPSNGAGTSSTSVSDLHPALDAAWGKKGFMPKHMREVSKYLHAYDDILKSKNGVSGNDIPNPEASSTLARRKRNLNKLFPMVDAIAHVAQHGKQYKDIKGEIKGITQWLQGADSTEEAGQQAYCDSVVSFAESFANMKGSIAASDAVTTSNLLNQPFILTVLLIQSFWDLNLFQYVEGIGPGTQTTGNDPGWFQAPIERNGGLGSIFRFPVEYVNYANMTGYAAQPVPLYDPGLLVPEGQPIDQLSIELIWLAFRPFWRRISAQPTRDVIRALGNGPLNYAVVARLLYNMTADKMRRIDIALGNQMFQTADNFGAVQNASELCTFADNSVWGATVGTITVNLNPAKTAVTTPATGDNYVTYGGLNGSTSNVIGAIRLQGPVATPSSTAYYGVALGPVPVCQPTTNWDFGTNGQVTGTVVNPFVITQAGGSYTAPVMGHFDMNGNIAPNAGGTVANFAVDWNNSVVIFCGAAATGSTSVYNAIVENSSTGYGANATSSTSTFKYSYITNYDQIVVNPATLGSGITPQENYANLLQQIDATAALMGSAGSGLYGRYVKPDLMLSTLNASVPIINAVNFYQLVSPRGTTLYPSEDYYADRNGVNFARTNTPWYPGDSRLLLTREGTTRYAIDTAWEVRGPQFAVDATTGNPIAQEIYFAEENSAIFTPQTTDVNGNVINPVAREILLR